MLPTPGELVADPTWSPDGRTVYATVGAGGFVDLVAFDVGSGARGAAGEPPRTLTRTVGAALAPAPTPDGRSLFFLGLSDRRPRRAAPGAVRPDAGRRDGRLRRDGARRPVPRDDRRRPRPPRTRCRPWAPPPRRARTRCPRPCPTASAPGSGTPLVGFAVSPAGNALQAGVAGTDPVGRLDWVAIGALSAGGAPKGAAVGATFRDPPIEMSFHLFSAELTPSAQGDDRGRAPVAAAGDLDVTRRGIAAERRWERRYAPFSLRLGLGLVAGQVRPDASADDGFPGATPSARRGRVSTAASS